MKRQKGHWFWGKVIFIILFAIALVAFRMLWINAFNNTEELQVVNGELDLRGETLLDNRSIPLVGDWRFHPSDLLQDISDQQHELNPQYITVPDDWTNILNPKDSSPYGYGSYHLRILVDEENAAYSMRVPSVRSASALYANGLLVGESGKVGETKEQSIAWNVPYSSTSIRADENGIIDIVLQVTNFEDPRASGLVRSVRFGYEADVKAETELSTLLQVATAVIFFIHALFAIILYVVGIHDKRLIYFALTIIALTFINVTGGDEKVFYQYVTVDYTTSFKLSMFVMVLFSWSLVHTVGPQIQTFSKKLLPIYSVLFSLFVVFIILLPLETLSAASNYTFGAVLTGAAITTFTLLRTRKGIQGGIWIALSVVAITNHYIWWAYSMGTGIKVIYYPFDLIIAIICLAGVWFKHYNEMYLATKDQALKLQKADKEKDEFLANTSHELRNPLHSILNLSEAVLEREGNTLHTESVKNLETALSVSRRMSFLLDELLELTRLKDGKLNLQLEATSLQTITDGVIDMVQFTLEGKPIQITNRISADVPAVMADENRVIQIVFNLLHNAVKFTQEGEVEVSAVVQEELVYLSVKDTGIGMDETTLQTIFTRYEQRNDEETMIEGGFGLGLNISKQLVELHGGTLWADSTLGEGTTFTFTLPLAPSEITTNTIKANHVTGNVVDLSEQKKKEDVIDFKYHHIVTDIPRILVVDDNPVNLEVVKSILSKKQYDMTSVLSGEAAFELLDKYEWDLVISDVMMPNMSGYELTRLIRKRFTISELPILLLTARNSREDLEAGFLVGANDYVAKPIDAVELRSRVTALTEVKRSARERLRMESAWLQAQIQPHFLFNTLNSIIALSEIDVARMQRVAEAFSSVLRRKIDFQHAEEFVPLAEELDLIRSYLYIEKERFSDRLQVDWEIDETLEIMIPGLSVQPLVENAINHGIMKQIQGGKITIRTELIENHAVISVEDDGVGIQADVLQKIIDGNQAGESGVGLLNTNRRLKRYYGKGFKVISKFGEGTKISFAVPLS